jgi:hypothetical protein
MTAWPLKPRTRARKERWAVPGGPAGQYVRISNRNRVRVKDERGHFVGKRPRTDHNGYEVVDYTDDAGAKHTVRLYQLRDSIRW